jgi:hypothetical protein
MEVDQAPMPVAVEADTPPDAPEHHDKSDELPTAPPLPPPSLPGARVLTPPTSEDMGKRDELETSDLSDLDSDIGEDDDIGDIQPDHYFEGGKIPVFKPVSATLLQGCFGHLK